MAAQEVLFQKYEEAEEYKGKVIVDNASNNNKKKIGRIKGNAYMM